MKKTIVMDGATRMNYSRCVHILMWMIVNIFDGLSSFPSSSFLLGMVAFALGLLDLICLTKNMNNVCIICFRQVVYALDYFVEKIKLYDCSQWCRRNVSLSCRCRRNSMRNSIRCNLRDSCRTNVAAMDVSGLDQEIEVGSIVAWKNLQKKRARHRFGYGVLFIEWFKFMAVVCFAMQVVVVHGYEKMPDGCQGKDYWARNCDLKEAIDALNPDGSGTHSTYGPVADWDMSLVTDLSGAFYNKGSFNGDISKWQTQKVKSMKGSK